MVEENEMRIKAFLWIALLEELTIEQA